MVRDILIDIDERDLLLDSDRNHSLPCFDVVWGNIFPDDEASGCLICNIIVPKSYWNTVRYEDCEFICCCKSQYKPEYSDFRMRLVRLDNGVYGRFDTIRGNFGSTACSYVFDKSTAQPLKACQLPAVNLDGNYLIRFTLSDDEAFDRAFVYSDSVSDINIGYSDNQAGQLLSLCAPGKLYRYPTIGVGITNYINSVVEHTGLSKRLSEQFENDGKMVDSAEFDPETGNFAVQFSPEAELPLEYALNITDDDRAFLAQFDDQFVRRNASITDIDDVDYVSLLSDYDNFIEIVFCANEGTSIQRIVEQVESGILQPDGTIEESETYSVITASVPANSIIMFDYNADDYTDSNPVFIVNGENQEILYKALVDQPIYLNDKCKKCAVLTQSAEIQYTISNEGYSAGRGLCVVPQNLDNVRNMVSIAEDPHTGGVMAIVSHNTLIDNVILEQITSHILALKQ